jgi:hypothetical protein
MAAKKPGPALTPLRQGFIRPMNPSNLDSARNIQM